MAFTRLPSLMNIINDVKNVPSISFSACSAPSAVGVSSVHAQLSSLHVKDPNLGLIFELILLKF